MNRRSYKGLDDYGGNIAVGDGYYNDAYEDEESTWSIKSNQNEYHFYMMKLSLCFIHHVEYFTSLSKAVMGDDNEPIKCKFPSWSMSGAIDAEDASQDGTWESFSLTSQYYFTPDGGRLIVSNFSHFFQVSQQVSLTR